MTPAERAAPLEGVASRADMSAVEIDIRCALELARIALQTLAETTPENQVRIQNAIDDAIDGARLEDSNAAEAVVGLLTDFKLRLADTARGAQHWSPEA